MTSHGLWFPHGMARRQSPRLVLGVLVAVAVLTLVVIWW